MADTNERLEEAEGHIRRLDGFLADAEFSQDTEVRQIRYFQAMCEGLHAIYLQNAVVIQMMQRQQELIGPLEDRIQSVIDGLRAERNITMVFDVSAPGNNIISADPVLDITSVVVSRLTGPSGGP